MDKWLLELTSKTVNEVDRILCMSGTEYSKEFGTETDRIDKAKIEKAQNLVGNLRFFLDKVMANEKNKVMANENE